MGLKLLCSHLLAQVSGGSTVADFDFFSDAFRADPHSQYVRMRNECPVAHATEPYDWWAATRASDVSQMLRRYKLWSSEHGPGLAYSGGSVLVSVDPPQHTPPARPARI